MTTERKLYELQKIYEQVTHEQSELIKDTLKLLEPQQQLRVLYELSLIKHRKREALKELLIEEAIEQFAE